MIQPTVLTAATPAPSPQMVLRPLRRWVKVDVSPEVFDRLHEMARKSGMRFQPYVRTLLGRDHPHSEK
jgi:hypothetical protein